MGAARNPVAFLGPILVAVDFEQTVGFYRAVLGLPVQGQAPYAEFRSASALLAIMDGRFLGRTGEIEVPSVRGLAVAAPVLLSFEVPDIEAMFERLVASGIRFTVPPSTRLPLGRKYAALQDPDGRTLLLMGPRTTPS